MLLEIEDPKIDGARVVDYTNIVIGEGAR